MINEECVFVFLVQCTYQLIIFIINLGKFRRNIFNPCVLIFIMILLTIFQNLWNGWHLYWRVISVLLFLFSSCIFLLSFTLYAKDFNFKKAFRHYEDNITNPSSNIQWIFSLRDWIHTHTCSPGHIGTRNCVFCALDNKDCQTYLF